MVCFVAILSTQGATITFPPLQRWPFEIHNLRRPENNNIKSLCIDLIADFFFFFAVPHWCSSKEETRKKGGGAKPTQNSCLWELARFVFIYFYTNRSPQRLRMLFLLKRRKGDECFHCYKEARNIVPGFLSVWQRFVSKLLCFVFFSIYLSFFYFILRTDTSTENIFLHIVTRDLWHRGRHLPVMSTTQS